MNDVKGFAKTLAYTIVVIALAMGIALGSALIYLLFSVGNWLMTL